MPVNGLYDAVISIFLTPFLKMVPASVLKNGGFTL